jgi:hypothetical protein
MWSALAPIFGCDLLLNGQALSMFRREVEVVDLQWEIGVRLLIGDVISAKGTTSFLNFA